ncbi:hypothetical protein D3C77_818100 [compost metagenome]|jgi:2-phospho-L-lactate transferase/gluconeogenesis factor (CofD/UPF0052 family)
MEEKIGRKMIDAVIVGPAVDTSAMQDRIVVQQPLEASDIPYRHDRQLLRQALDTALVQLASRG